jgi:hypothetical protein
VKNNKNTLIRIDAPYAIAYGDLPGVNKIIFMDNLKQWHYTLMQNDYDKVLDLHKTRGPKEWDGIIKIGYRDCTKLLVGFSKYEETITRKFIQIFRTISLGKLIRLNAILMPEVTEEQHKAFLKIKGKRISVKRKIQLSDLEALFIYPREISETNSNSFTVFIDKRGRRTPAGILFKTSKKQTFLYLSNDKQIQFAKFLTRIFIHLVNDTPLKSKTKLSQLLDELI